MLLGFLVYMSSSSMPQWMIDNINTHTLLHLSPYNPISNYEMAGFGVFLIVLVFLYYTRTNQKNSFFSIFGVFLIVLVFLYYTRTNQKNSFFSIFNFAPVTQTNTIGGATKENQEAIQAQLDILMQQTTNISLSNAEKKRLEDEILTLKRELIALTVNDDGIKKAQEIMLSDQSDKIDKALLYIEEFNTNKQIEKLKEQNHKQASILCYKATLYEQKREWSKAKKCYEDALRFENSYDANFEYAYFLQTKVPNDRRADTYYSVALEKSKNKSQKSMTLNNLANFYSKDSSKRKEAEDAYVEALQIYRALAKENKAVYWPDVAMTLNNLAAFYADDSSKRKEAEDAYVEALEIRRALAKENKAVYARDCANILVMGVDLFGAPKTNLDEASRLLEVYPDNYMNVGWLHQMIAKLKQ